MSICQHTEDTVVTFIPRTLLIILDNSFKTNKITNYNFMVNIYEKDSSMKNET